MSGFCKQARWKDASFILHSINHGNTQENCKVFSRLLQDCVNTKDVEQGKRVHAHVTKAGLGTFSFLNTHLVNMYAKCGKPESARQVFDKMHDRSVVSWTSVIAGYVQNGCCQEALDIFPKMQRDSVRPDEFTFPCVFKACAGLEALWTGKQVHTHILKIGFDSDVFVNSSLLDMYAKCGSSEDAWKLFDKMPERNIVSWSAMIAGCVVNGRAEEGLRIFEEMRRTNVEGNYVLFSSVLNACVNIPALEQGKQVHAHVIKSGLDIYMSVGNALVDLYGKCGCVEDSRIAFDKIDARNVVSWGALIAGHVQNGYNEVAMDIYGQMRQEGIEASEYIFSSVLKACASLAGLEKGRQIHSHVIKTMFDSDVYVGSALVDMYGKSGTVADACQMFDKMPQRNVVSWNAMIASCAQHGHGKKALNCFEKMQFDGFKPNYITFVCLLTACSHAGLVEKGMCYFNSMTQDYGIGPGAEHYACIVDLLGRAGLLGEAEKFMKSIPLKPTASMWGALLGACRVHGNTELGRRAAECLFELDPQNSGTHVLLSNSYAAASRWNDVAKVRSVMKDIGMKKEPGRSWIGVKNKEHSFYANDKTHPLTKEIYALLENWSEQMKKVGYASDTNYVLLNVEEKQKDDFLYYHSEKLALAFGFLSISPGIPIRIMKNLRMCGDCHTYIKFISGIVGREIVVRDTNRFHHFRGNTCSCGDYW